MNEDPLHWNNLRKLLNLPDPLPPVMPDYPVLVGRQPGLLRMSDRWGRPVRHWEVEEPVWIDKTLWLKLEAFQSEWTDAQERELAATGTDFGDPEAVRRLCETHPLAKALEWRIRQNPSKSLVWEFNGIAWPAREPLSWRRMLCFFGRPSLIVWGRKERLLRLRWLAEAKIRNAVGRLLDRLFPQEE